MNTPICDFVRRYCEDGAVRAHMPGHKGTPLLGFEHLDITEVDGADSLYEADGIIAESEKNASQLFGCPTFFSTEGSSQCIRAMLHLAMLHAKAAGKKPVVAAGRNAHKVFLSAAALLNFDVQWLYPARTDSYLSCTLTADDLDAALTGNEVAAVYVTSPDYLGNISDISALAEVAHRHGCLLLVDNAHGAYLRFLTPSRHPIDLGADLCCDSAHKTLPALTGAAYLHISGSVSESLAGQAKNALALFGSTSPSYLILQSLDAVNFHLADGYGERLAACADRIQQLRKHLRTNGYVLRGNEPLKITIDAKPYGYSGHDLAAALKEKNVFCEFHDPDFIVLMLTPEMVEDDLQRLEDALLSIPQRTAISDPPPAFHRCEQALPLREAVLSPSICLATEACVGKILAATSLSCPPAIPIVICGERIDEAAAARLRYYGIESCFVIVH